MKLRALGIAALCLALVAGANADVLITEVIDGTLPGGIPKVVELTNCGASGVTFGADDYLRVYFNGNTSPGNSVPLDGVTIAAGESLAITPTDQATFETVYGTGVNVLYVGGSFGNGDDVYSLENAVTGWIDIYGEYGVDGTGMVWEYTDGYAYRNTGSSQNLGSFFDTEWTFGGVNSIEGADDAESTLLMQTLTDPGAHTCGTAGDPRGACCIGETCSITTMAGCTGTYLGNGTNCFGNPCAGDPNCSTIAEARLLGADQPVRICNVVVTSTTDLISSGFNKAFTIQPKTGMVGGITVYGSNAIIDGLGVQVGDEITIEGTTDEFNGLIELVDAPAVLALDIIQNLGTTTLPPVNLVTGADLADGSATGESLESRVIKVECVSFINPGTANFEGGANYTVMDGLGNFFQVRIATADLDMVGTPIPSTPVDITGVLGQYTTGAPDEGYQLQPRSLADIVAGTGCPTLLGACCLPDDTCLPSVTAGDCAAQEGIWTLNGDCADCPAAPTSALRITEIMYDPASTPDGDWEFVEVYNNGGSAIDLTGYVMIDDDVTLSAANIAGGTIGAGETAVLYPAALVSEAELDAAWDFFGDLMINWIPVDPFPSMSNGGDRIGLWDSFGSYRPDPNAAPDWDAAMLNILFLRDGTWPRLDANEGTVGASIYLTNPLANPAYGVNWTGSIESVDDAYRSEPAGDNFETNVGSPSLIPPVVDPTGACCIPNFGTLTIDCQILTASNCTAAGGVKWTLGGMCPDDCTCFADLDESGAIGFDDLNILLASYGGAGDYTMGDLDGDDDVDFDDLNILLALYNTTCP